MQPKSLGIVSVTTPGSPVALTADPSIRAQRVRAAVVIGHTGKAYLGTKTMNRTTFEGVVKEFWPTGAGGGVADEVTIEAPTGAGNALRLSDLAVDANVPGEGLLIEYWVA